MPYHFLRPEDADTGDRIGRSWYYQAHIREIEPDLADMTVTGWMVARFCEAAAAISSMSWPGGSKVTVSRS